MAVYNRAKLFYWRKFFDIPSETLLKKVDVSHSNVLGTLGLIKKLKDSNYIMTPFLLRSFEKLCHLIDDEMQLIGAQKVIMPTLISASLWKASGRWDVAGPELYKLKDRHNEDFCLAPTHEEAVTFWVGKANPPLYQLPVYLYQTTAKFRDEIRPKSGLLRSKEFYMKDLYTFDATEKDAHKTYKKVCQAYERLFRRLELNVIKCDASVGKIGGKFSHEYHISSEIGQDEVIVCNICNFAQNTELLTEFENARCVKCGKETVVKRCIELGHSFYLGSKYSSSFNASYKRKDGKRELLQMGCYGLGIGRILTAAVQILASEESLRWPLDIVPFRVCFELPKKGSKEELGVPSNFVQDVINSVLQALNEDILIDDRTHLTIGKRWPDVKMLGIPYIVIAGKRITEEIPLFEIFDTYNNQTYLFNHAETLQFLKDNLKSIKYA